jgi:hypothetical protein
MNTNGFQSSFSMIDIFNQGRVAQIVIIAKPTKIQNSTQSCSIIPNIYTHKLNLERFFSLLVALRVK